MFLLKNIWFWIVIVGVVIFGCILSATYFNHPNTYSDTNSYKDITYSVDGKEVTLFNGSASTDIVPGSASKLVTQYFGNEARGDLNGDGMDDIAFLLTQNSGGSGTFYYVALALATKNGYIGTNAVLLGDRIAPQTTEIRGSELIVNYADRKPTDSFATPPSVGVSKYLKVSGTTLVEVKNP